MKIHSIFMWNFIFFIFNFETSFKNSSCISSNTCLFFEYVFYILLRIFKSNNYIYFIIILSGTNKFIIIAPKQLTHSSVLFLLPMVIPRSSLILINNYFNSNLPTNPSTELPPTMILKRPDSTLNFPLLS